MHQPPVIDLDQPIIILCIPLLVKGDQIYDIMINQDRACCSWTDAYTNKQKNYASQSHTAVLERVTSRSLLVQLSDTR